MRRPIFLALFASVACAPAAPPQRSVVDRPDATVPTDAAADAADAEAPDAADGGDDAIATTDAADATTDDDPMALHRDSRDALLGLFDDPAPFVSMDFEIGPVHINQGNKAVAHHAIAKRACLDGLRGVVLQTPEQRERCGAPNMVPVWDKGDASRATFCIDIFEFPNKACELPLVWMSPVQAQQMCKAQGKRLCDQREWNLACRADPGGGADRLYAYGDDLDLAACNTSKSRQARTTKCSLQTMRDMWTTCTTDTEPSGAYPKCRSRFGVFDQHGNVAEIMTRLHWDGFTYDQLKGSSFFYVDVAKKPSEPGGYYTRYPDHCNFDPRWHVERIETASHVNYHLGFRCCKAIGSVDAGAPGDASR